MPRYDLRLYKRSAPGSRKHTLVNRIPYEAPNDNEAVSLAPGMQVPIFEDSDIAMLFSEDGQVLWTLKVEDAHRT